MAQFSQLLLFDPDPSGLDTLSYGFEKDGWSVTATSDATKARDLIHGAGPALVVVNFRELEQVGLDLLRATTSNPRTRNVACVAIGRSQFRAAALGAGAFVFLSIPLFVRDVLGACRLVVAASVPGSRPSPDAELSLSMADIDSVYFLVRSLAVSGRSTAIELRHGTTRGDLRFIDGTLTSAQVGAVQGLPALHRMLLWQTASLKFRFKNVVRRGSQLAMKSSEVIEECDRFLRDFAHEVKALGFVHSVYRKKANDVPQPEGLPSEVVPVLKLFDGHRDLGEILEASPFRVFDTLKIINRFATTGAIVATTAAPALAADIGPTLSGPAALEFWFQRPASLLGAELGGGQRAEALRAATKQVPAAAQAGGRVPSPFMAVASGPLATASSAPLAAASVASTRDDSPTRARTATRKNVVQPAARPTYDAAQDIVTPPPVLIARMVAASSTAAPAPSALPAIVTKPLQVAPAPLLQPATPAPQPRAPLAAPAAPAPATAVAPAPPVAAPISKPAAAMATGEIKAVPARQTGSVPVVGSPTVLVDIGPLPAAVSMAPADPAPMTAQVSPPSVIIAPTTPPPVVAPRPRLATPTPAAVDGKDKRPPSGSFNALESDFFEREADLYKRESIETFEDLDRTHPKSNGRKR